MNPHQDSWVNVTLTIRAIGVQVAEPLILCLDRMWTAPFLCAGREQSTLYRATSLSTIQLAGETQSYSWKPTLTSGFRSQNLSFAGPCLGPVPPRIFRTQPGVWPVAAYMKGDGMKVRQLESRKERGKKCRKERGLLVRARLFLKMNHHLLDFFIKHWLYVVILWVLLGSKP